MDLQGSWLFRGYFEVSDPSGGPSITQQVRDSLAARLGRSPASFRIASYPVGPAWRHTFWWREGDSDYAEAQFFARIAEEYPVLSVGVSVEKGLEDPNAAPSAKRATFVMDRKTWDWQCLKNRAKDVLTVDVPACASLVSRPLELRFYAHRYVRGKATTRERRAFVFRNGAWFERHVGKATEATILGHVRDLDKKRGWWVDAYFGCDLFPNEVEGMKADTLAGILSSFGANKEDIVLSTTGQVYDLDYIQNANWCQVLIRDGFVGFVRDLRLQSPLETAMQIGAPVTVDHDDGQPKRILRVVLRHKPPAIPPAGLHYVVELDIDEQDGKCKAVVFGADQKEVKVFTRDVRMESILATALREEWKIGYLTFDPASNEITRGKLNVEDQRRK